MERGESDKKGAEYLTLLGFGQIVDQEVTVKLPAKSFLLLCGEHAIPGFEYFKTLDPNSEEYEKTRIALTGMVNLYIKPAETNQ